MRKKYTTKYYFFCSDVIRGSRPVLRDGSFNAGSQNNVPSENNNNLSSNGRPLSLIEQFQQQELERKYKASLEKQTAAAAAEMQSPLVIEHANLDDSNSSLVIDKDPSSNQRRKVSGESLVQIYVPEVQKKVYSLTKQRKFE